MIFRKWQPTPVLPGKSHGQKSWEGHNPKGPKESDTTERLSASMLNKSKIKSWFPNKIFFSVLLPFLVNIIPSSSFQLLKSKALGIIIDFFLLYLQISLSSNAYWLCLPEYPKPVLSLVPPLYHVVSPSTVVSFLDYYNTLLMVFLLLQKVLLKSVFTREIFENVRQCHFSIWYGLCFLNLFRVKVKVFCDHQTPSDLALLHPWFHLLRPCHSLGHSYSIAFLSILQKHQVCSPLKFSAFGISSCQGSPSPRYSHERLSEWPPLRILF